MFLFVSHIDCPPKVWKHPYILLLIWCHQWRRHSMLTSLEWWCQVEVNLAGPPAQQWDWTSSSCHLWGGQLWLLRIAFGPGDRLYLPWQGPRHVGAKTFKLSTGTKVGSANISPHDICKYVIREVSISTWYLIPVFVKKEDQYSFLKKDKFNKTKKGKKTQVCSSDTERSTDILWRHYLLCTTRNLTQRYYVNYN